MNYFTNLARRSPARARTRRRSRRAAGRAATGPPSPEMPFERSRPPCNVEYRARGATRPHSSLQRETSVGIARELHGQRNEGIGRARDELGTKPEARRTLAAPRLVGVSPAKVTTGIPIHSASHTADTALYRNVSRTDRPALRVPCIDRGTPSAQIPAARARHRTLQLPGGGAGRSRPPHQSTTGRCAAPRAALPSRRRTQSGRSSADGGTRTAQERPRAIRTRRGAATAQFERQAGRGRMSAAGIRAAHAIREPRLRACGRRTRS